MSGIPLTRSLTVEALRAGQWCNDTTRHTVGMMCTITVCCPGCSGKTDLTSEHHVEPDGKVRPAFACASCAFFEPIVLEDWRQLT